MNRLLLIALLAFSLVGVAGQGAQPAAAQTGTSWAAEYYNNIHLIGPPVHVDQVIEPGFNWTDTAPAPNLPADNWSVRYSGNVTLNGGLYEVLTRADDGVRVYVNGVLLVNEFHTSSGLTYRRQFQANTGQNTVVVEYYEGVGVAFLSFQIQPVATIPPTVPPLPVPTSATATVTAYYLNVRSAPGLHGSVLATIARGQTYPVIGRDAGSTWWQINVNGIVGWASGKYLQVYNSQYVPITAPGTPTTTQYTVTALVNLNIRQGPGTSYSVVGWLPIYQSARVTARNTASSWWQINYGGVTGWVSAYYASLPPGSNINLIPVVEPGGAPTPTTYTVQARVNLNIRMGPSTAYPVTGWLPIYQSAVVIGRNAANSWWRITYGGYSGWISAYYAPLPVGANVSQIPIAG